MARRMGYKAGRGIGRYQAKAEKQTDWNGLEHRDKVLKLLGFKTYAEYLASPHWQEVRRRWGNQPCDIENCEGKAELHHWTYIRFGREERKDLIPLCRLHHGSAHKIMWETGCGLRAATRAITGPRGHFNYRQSWLAGREPKALAALKRRT